ncbi:MAG: hypothetical protein P1Q69_10195 [Candidatus Thorarchaeota archaeon]|nr:hypothetical protein [Candidatus Thorarchaeota archaeon]
MSDEGGFFYYLALLAGMFLIGAYLWLIIIVPSYSQMFQLILILSGILIVAAAMMFIYARTRSSRIGLTVMTGILGGIHGYLDLALYGWFIGLVLFAWMAFGLILAVSAYNWLYE